MNVNWKGVVVSVILGAVLGVTMTAIVGSEAPSVVEGGPGVMREAEELGLRVHDSIGGPLALESVTTLDPRSTLYVVIDPERPFGSEEVQAFDRFLGAGGKVLVFDSFGHSGDLTGQMGVAIERVRLVDTGGGSVQVQDGQKTWSLALDTPSVIQITPGAQAEVTAWSTEGSFIDRDGDGLVSEQEPEGSFPVIAEVAIGTKGGALVLVADEGLADSAPAGSQNEAWRKSMMARLLPGGGDVVRDFSGAYDAGGALGGVIGGTLRFTMSDPWRVMFLGAGVLGLSAIAIPLVQTYWRSHRFRPHRYIRRDRLAQEILQMHGDETGKEGVEKWTARGVTAIASTIVLLVGGLVFGNAQATLAAMTIATAIIFAAVPKRAQVTAVRQVAFKETQEGADIPVALELQSKTKETVQIMDRVADEVEIREGKNQIDSQIRRGKTPMEYVVSPSVAGPQAIGPLSLKTQDPFGLRFRLEQILDPDHIRVFPRDQGLSKLPHKARTAAIIMGLHQVNKAGDGTEFHALREYQTGDSLRAVNWKASARTKDLMVNQRIHESMTDLTVVLDTRAVSAAGPVSWTPLAQGRRVAVSIFSAALRARDRVRLVSYGSEVNRAPTAPGMEQLHLVNQYLSDLYPDGDMTMLEAITECLNDFKPGSPAILISGLESDPSVPQAVSLLRSRNINPVIIALDISAPEDEEEQSMEATVSERDDVLGHLRAIGAPVYENDPNVPLDYLFRLGGL